MDEPREVWVVEHLLARGWCAEDVFQTWSQADEWETEVRNEMGDHSGFRTRRYLPAEGVREVLEAARDGLICDEKRLEALRIIEAALKEQGA